MPDNFYGGLDFGTSGARISIINFHKKLVYSNSVPYLYSFSQELIQEFGFLKLYK